MNDNSRLVDEGDIDALVRRVDDLCATRDWEALADLRRRCRAALDTGRQLWPVAVLAAHRLALGAPPAIAVQALEDPGTFGIGPLTEVLASRATWAELEPHLPPGAARALVAHERVARGEDLTGADIGHDPLDGLALRPHPWEPGWPVATYTDDAVTVPEPEPVSGTPLDLPEAEQDLGPDTATSALRSCVEHWASASNGRVEVVAVRGTARTAIASLGVRTATGSDIDTADALGRLAWASASGAAHARRRGAARGRFDAWWFTACALGLDDDWPLDPDELAPGVGELLAVVWRPRTPPSGWELHLAVEDPVEGVAWAITATDERLT